MLAAITWRLARWYGKAGRVLDAHGWTRTADVAWWAARTFADLHDQASGRRP